MSEFVIYPQKVRQTYDGFDACSRQLTDCYSSLYTIRDTLRGISSLSGVVGPVEIVAKRIETQDNTVKNLKNVLGSCVQLYENTEGRCIGSSSAVPAVPMITPSNGGTVSSDVQNKKDKSDFKLWTWKDTWNVVKEFGIIGGTVGTIGGLTTGGINPKTIVGALKDTSKVVGNVAKASSSPSINWKALFGLNVKADAPKNFWQALGKEVDKYNMGNATKVSDKIAVGAKWAGSVLTVVSVAMDNFDKKSGNSTGRAIAETIGESAVKIGEGMLIGAAATAIAATVGAPAVVAGLATVGVTWAIDKGFEWATGKNAAEYISDTIIDGAINKGKEVIAKTKEVKKMIGNATSSIGKKLSGWWNQKYSLAW